MKTKTGKSMKRQDIIKWIHSESPNVESQIQRWLTEILQKGDKSDEFMRGLEIIDNEIVVLLRPYTNRYPGNCLTICTVNLPPELQRKGWFKSFLNLCCRVNPWNDVVIEDVGNEHLFNFCARNNFSILHPCYKTTFIVNQDIVREMNILPLEDYSYYLTLSKSENRVV